MSDSFATLLHPWTCRDPHPDTDGGWLCRRAAADIEFRLPPVGLDEEGSLAFTALNEAIRKAAMLRTEQVTITAPLARYLAARLAGERA